MTQHERLIQLFKANGGTLTHAQIAATDLYREHSARMSDLRKKGYAFNLRKGKTTSENAWTMIEPFVCDENGQGRMAI